jgi:two-component system cell cycle response regulator
LDDQDLLDGLDEEVHLEERTAIMSVGDIGRSSLMPSQPDRHVLVRIDSTNVGQVFTLTGEEFTLGRHTSNNLVLTDDGVSRKHCRLAPNGSGFTLEDLGSANGTFVGGQRIEKHVLGDGDVFQLGPNVLFRYAYTDAGQERMLQKLYEASVRDALTGTYNREHLEERLKMEVAFARRHNTVLSVVIFDLDHFKKVNDTHGHPAGDAVLVAVAERVQKALRTEDVFARYGGEEFVVILRGIDLEGAGKVGERLRAIVSASPVPFGQVQIPVTLSAGCAALTCCPEPSTVAIVAIADRRLYAAKRAGRNRSVAEG